MLELENAANKNTDEALENLLHFSGFPEPLFSNSEDEAARWRVSYGYRLIKEDIQSLEKINEVDKTKDLYDQLPKTIGSPLSINSLREDLEVNFRTASRWIDIFDKNYVSFRIPPYGAPKIRAVKKNRNCIYGIMLALKKNKPIVAIEVKESEQSLDSNLKYLLERVKIPYAFQIHLNGKTLKKLESINGSKIVLAPAARFLLNLL